MNSILKWLHKNEGLVHMSTMLVVFYGIPTAAFAVFHPGLVEPLIDSALVGLTLVALIYVAYKTASSVTEWIKNAVTIAALDQMRQHTIAAAKTVVDPVVDYESSHVLVVNNSSEETKESVENLKAAISPPAETAVAKKRPGRPKAAKKEA